MRRKGTVGERVKHPFLLLCFELSKISYMYNMRSLTHLSKDRTINYKTKKVYTVYYIYIYNIYVVIYIYKKVYI